MKEIFLELVIWLIGVIIKSLVMAL